MPRVRALKEQAGLPAGTIGNVLGQIVYFKDHGSEYVQHCRNYPEWYQEIADNQLILSELVEGKRYRCVQDWNSYFVGKTGIFEGGYFKTDNGAGEIFKSESAVFIEVPEPKEEKPQMMVCDHISKCKWDYCLRGHAHQSSHFCGEIYCDRIHARVKCIPYVEKSEEKNCESCGNMACRNPESGAIRRDCLTGFSRKHWKPKKEGEWERLLNLMELNTSIENDNTARRLFEAMLRELIRRDREGLLTNPPTNPFPKF